MTEEDRQAIWRGFRASRAKFFGLVVVEEEKKMTEDDGKHGVIWHKVDIK